MQTHDCAACGAAGAGGVGAYPPDPDRTAMLPRLGSRPVPQPPYVCLNRLIIGTDGDSAPCPMAAYATVATPASRTGYEAPDPWSAQPTGRVDVFTLLRPVVDGALDERLAADVGLFPLDMSTSARSEAPATRSSSRRHLRQRPLDRRLIVVIAACAAVVVGMGLASSSGAPSVELAVPAPTDGADSPTAPGQSDAPSPDSPVSGPPTATTGPATPSRLPTHTAARQVISVPSSHPAPPTTQPSPTPAALPPSSTNPQPSPATTRSSPTPPVGDPSTLHLGDSGAGVKSLQRRLTQAWCYTGKPNGMYDQRTHDAVAQFQFWYDIQGDPPGVYGPATRRALETSFP